MKNKIIIIFLCFACGLLSCIRTDSSTTTKELTQNEIAETIHKVSHSGLRGNSETLMKYVEMINSYNVGPTVNTYMNTYNESMFGALMRNRFISSETRANAVRHIKDMFMELSKRDGIYIDDLDKLMEGHIEYEKNKFGRMKSKDMDEELKVLTDRYNQTLQENILYSANGKIDNEFKQGPIGDCWLISTIKSLSLYPKGVEMLNDLISVDEKGDVTIQMKGVDRDYTISKEDLEGANEFAQGDLDVRAIELAVSRYLHDLGDHTNLFKRTKNMFKNISMGVLLLSPDYDMYNGISVLSTAYNMLFDLEPDLSSHNITIEKIKSGEYSTIVASNKYDSMDGFVRHHVYAVTRADDNYVYLSNPNNPNIELKMAQVDFFEYFDCKSSIKL